MRVRAPNGLPGSGTPTPPSSPAAVPHGPGKVSRLRSFLGAHPILCLLMLSPGIPEYLSGSSPLSALVLNPPQFAFQLALNLGLYGPGVLLIREAMIRWKKGWASVLLLGTAYGILEEGIALSTLFNPKAAPVGEFGYFGHWLGVNWIWLVGIVPFHAIYSISIPILLLGLALPETRGRSLVSRRGICAACLILAADVGALFSLVLLDEHFWMGTPVLVSSLLAIGLLVFLARAAPTHALRARARTPRVGPRLIALSGVAFYPAVLIVENATKIPLLSLSLVLSVEALFLILVLREVGRSGNELQLLALTFGLIAPIAAFGIISQVAFPVVILGDAAWILTYTRMWRRYRDSSSMLGAQEPDNVS